MSLFGRYEPQVVCLSSSYAFDGEAWPACGIDSPSLFLFGPIFNVFKVTESRIRAGHGRAPPRPDPSARGLSRCLAFAWGRYVAAAEAVWCWCF